MAGAHFEKHGGFHGASELAKATDHFKPRLQPADRRWLAQPAKPALQLVINGIAQIRRQSSHQVLNRGFVFPMHGDYGVDGEPAVLRRGLRPAPGELALKTGAFARAMISRKVRQTCSTSSTVRSGSSGRLISSG